MSPTKLLEPKETSVDTAIEPCLNLKIRQASRVLTQRYDHSMAQEGLKTGQYSVLRCIYFLKETTNKVLQEYLVMDQTTLTRALKPLIRDGLITTRESEQDKREKLLSLSEDGVSRYKSARKVWQETQSEIKTQLGEEACQALLELSNTIVKLKH